MAAPATEKELSALNDFVELFREPASGSGTMIYLGYPYENGMTTPADSTTEKQVSATCPQPVLMCDTNNFARNNLCAQLVAELQLDSTVPLPGTPRQVCYLGDGVAPNAYCCASWTTPVPGLTKGDLVEPASRIFKTCTANGISGKVDNLVLHDICVALCLSNRGTGC
ncbi:hypothetical protein K461DRAFT_295582 [Myriangium duriaei CBS 260.36]|uniref:WD-like domain-containing protein n=1 Tax=Myriangium duriaei CBS 260.36 TaxID=1168546 RepID=A0A9P4IYR8_9PEZI|nr:hypothetical protein K461DRAFT_295582 [Myriangium duriaei CBS 260.36]